MASNENSAGHLPELPSCASEYITSVVCRVRYRKRVRRDIAAELTAHFEDELRNCTTAEERDARARQVIEGFGDPKLLAILCRRAKKRCRPLWAKALSGALKVVGLFLLVFMPYTAWFVRGQPHPTIDYLAELNALSATTRPEDDAWPYYEKALRLTVPPDGTFKETSWFKHPVSGGTPTAQERIALQNWMAENDLAWQQYEVAARRKDCHRTYGRETSKSLLVQYTLDPAEILPFSRLSLWKSHLACEQGKVEEACASSIVLARVGAHWQSNMFLTHQLVGLAMSGLACQAILEIVTAHQLSPSDLSDLQAQLTDVYGGRYPSINYRGERLIVLDAIQNLFTDGGPGGGHRVFVPAAGRKWAMNLLEVAPDDLTFRMLMPESVLLSMIHASRDRTVAKVNEMYDRIIAIAELSPYERSTRHVADLSDVRESLGAWRYSAVYGLIPLERRLSEQRFRGKADYEATLTVLALLRCRAEKGRYPPSLSFLVEAGYLKAVPLDPYSDSTLVYRQEGDTFVLYSLGPNITDDGGKQGTDANGKPKTWQDSGDTVFWPVIRSKQ
jgi:hypothetical protein